jgi:hypothetical protein
MVAYASKDVPQWIPRLSFIAASEIALIPACQAFGVNPYAMSDSNLGSEPFQIRVMSYGERLPELGERGVLLGSYLMDDGGSAEVARQRDLVSTWSIAQSEYYFVGDEDDMLWRMRWRARLRRFSGRPAAGAIGEVYR